MSIRQLRLTSPDQIKNGINDLIGKPVNVVLNDKTVVLCKLQSVDHNGVVVQNMRLKALRFLFTNITEIYFDKIV